MKKTALFAGTFDPFTIGHDAIVKRSLAITDKLIIAIGHNAEKKRFFPVEESMAAIRQLYRKTPVIHVTSYNTLTVDFAKQMKVDFLIRGVRNPNDFEFEKTMADFNRNFSGIDTFFLFSEPAYAYISSNLVRELLIHKKDISNLIPNIK